MSGAEGTTVRVSAGRLNTVSLTRGGSMRNALHFVGFRGEEYHSACLVFGKPDFVHVHWDKRAVDEVFLGDKVVFANKENSGYIHEYTHNDSQFM